jgi:hypothetical protein
MEIACSKGKKSCPRISLMNANKKPIAGSFRDNFMRKENIRGDSRNSRAENLILVCQQ